MLIGALLLFFVGVFSFPIHDVRYSSLATGYCGDPAAATVAPSNAQDPTDDAATLSPRSGGCTWRVVAVEKVRGACFKDNGV